MDLLFLFTLDRCNTSSEVYSTKTIIAADKNYCNPFISSVTCPQKFEGFLSVTLKTFWWRQNEARGKTAHNAVMSSWNELLMVKRELLMVKRVTDGETRVTDGETRVIDGETSYWWCQKTTTTKSPYEIDIKSTTRSIANLFLQIMLFLLFFVVF